MLAPKHTTYCQRAIKAVIIIRVAVLSVMNVLDTKR